MTQNKRKPWFAPKRIGYGSGLPIAAEGWLALTIYVVVVTVAAICLPSGYILPIIMVATVLLGIVCARRTDGGWRWRGD